MAKRLAPALLIVGLLFSATAAVADHPITIPMSWVSLSFKARIAPVKLPKSQRAGVSLRIDSKVSTEDGSHPPALKELLLDLDRNFAINARGLPSCHPRLLEADETAGAEMDCKTAIVGEGKAEIEIAQPEQAPQQDEALGLRIPCGAGIRLARHPGRCFERAKRYFQAPSDRRGSQNRRRVRLDHQLLLEVGSRILLSWSVGELPAG